MKKTIVAATLLAMTSGVALAEDQTAWDPAGSVNTGNKGAGEVRFQGEVKAASCTITVAGQANNATVKLPIINTNEFQKNDTKYKSTNFNIELSDCESVDGLKNAGVSWTEALLSDNAKGYLANHLEGKADSAQGVSLVISDKKGKIMIPGTHVETQTGSTEHYSNKNSSAVAEFKEGVAVIPFTVAYVTSDKATVKAGKIESRAVYSVFYE